MEPERCCHHWLLTCISVDYDTVLYPKVVCRISVIPLNLSTFTCKVSSFVCGSGIRAYEQLGYRAFGTPGKMAAGIAITLQNIGGEDTPRSSVLTPGSPGNTSLCIFESKWIFVPPVCSHVQLPVHRQIWVSSGHRGLSESGQPCRVRTQHTA